MSTTMPSDIDNSESLQQKKAIWIMNEGQQCLMADCQGCFSNANVRQSRLFEAFALENTDLLNGRAVIECNGSCTCVTRMWTCKHDQTMTKQHL